MHFERHPTRPGVLHPLRASDLTCSDLGAAAGVDQYQTPLQLHARKTGRLQAQTDNPMMQRGRWLEPGAITAFRERHPHWEVRKAHVYLRDPEVRLGGTPDAVAISDEEQLVNIQLKVIARPQFDSWDGVPPTSYLLQTLGEGMLVEADYSILACLVIDTYSADLAEFVIERHAGAEARIRQLAVEFWDNVAHNRVPLPNPAKDAETVAELYPAPVPEKILDLSSDNLLPGLLAERSSLKQRITTDTQRVSEIDTDIKAKLADAERASVPGWRLSWLLQHRKAYTVPETSLRVLRVTEEQAA